MPISGRYKVILADPPWSYRDTQNAKKRGAAWKYPTMTPKRIRELPVGELAAPDCMLFLWTTGPQLAVALDVIEAWGFRYRTFGFVWIKLTAKGIPAMGMGLACTRSNAELCLYAVKGKPKRQSASVRQVIMTPRLGHSVKPPEIRDRIVELSGDVPRVELFARARADGWHAWGNQIEPDPEAARVLGFPERVPANGSL